MKPYWTRTLGFLGTVLALCSGLCAQETCPGEIKLLLSPSTIQTVIVSLGFEHKAAGQVYLFDTDELDLMQQGLIVRVRQGQNNDLTVKIRWPAHDKEVDRSKLRKHFPCEMDRTGAGEDISYSVGRKYKPSRVPKTGEEILRILNGKQEKILQEAGVTIDWSQVKRLANIKLTKWESAADPPFGKLTLELWESSGGNILELSTKVAPGAGASNYAELQRLLEQKGLALSANQGTKTSVVLENLAHPESPLK
jgi:hypothetical protein